MKIEEFEQLKSRSIGHSLIKAARIYKDFSFNTFKEHIGINELKPSHLDLMAYIEFEGITVVDIAKKAKISKQAVSILVNEMVGFGVLKKRDNPLDKRSSLICFNEKSDVSVFEGMKFLASLDEEIINLIGERKTKTVVSVLNQIIDNFSSR